MPAQHPRVTLRPARAEDVVKLLEWRNDAEAVRFSASGRAVSFDEHEGWLAERLGDPRTRMWIAERDGAAVGQVRLDVEMGTGTVSIAVAAEQRGRGIGLAMVLAMVDSVAADSSVRRLVALAHRDNRASLHLFQSAGFRPWPPGQEGDFVQLER